MWKRKQKVVENWLRIKHTDIKLSGPLCFERWIRCLEMGEGSYGRSSIIFILRFALIYIAIPAVSIVASILIYGDKATNATFYDVAIRKLPCIDIILFSILGYFSIKICMENKVAYQIQKEYLDG